MKPQKQLIVLSVLIGIAAVAWFWSSRQLPQAAGATTIISSYQTMNVDNPEIQWDKIKRVQATDYKAGGKNPFSDAPVPPPPQKVLHPGEKGYVKPPQVIPPPPPDPTLPPNMKFFGYGTVPNGSARRAFLSDGDEVYIVAEGDTFLARFRIVKIGNATLEFEEISSGRKGKANIAEDAGPSA